MHLLVLSPYIIRLMHGHGLFKTLMLIEADLIALPRRKLCLTHAISCYASFFWNCFINQGVPTVLKTMVTSSNV